MDDKKVIMELIKDLKHKDFSVQDKAISSLVIKCDDAVPHLARILPGRLRGISALEDLSHGFSGSIAKKQMKDSENELANIVEVLCTINSPKAIEVLIEAFDSPIYFVRNLDIMDSIKKGNPLLASGLFFKALSNPNPVVRKLAIGEIAKTRSAGFFQTLVPLLEDEDSDVREAALMALNAISELCSFCGQDISGKPRMVHKPTNTLCCEECGRRLGGTVDFVYIARDSKACDFCHFRYVPSVSTFAMSPESKCPRCQKHLRLD